MRTDTLRLASDLAQRGEPFALVTAWRSRGGQEEDGEFTGYPYGGNALLAPCSSTTTRKKRLRGMTP